MIDKYSYGKVYASFVPLPSFCHVFTYNGAIKSLASIILCHKDSHSASESMAACFMLESDDMDMIRQSFLQFLAGT